MSLIGELKYEFSISVLFQFGCAAFARKCRQPSTAGFQERVVGQAVPACASGRDRDASEFDWLIC